jgi:lysozyme
MDRQLLARELTRDEGARLRSYKDSVGLWTIGIGHLLGAEQRMTEITEAEMYALFEADVTSAELLVRGLFPTYPLLDDVRQRVLVNMAFNLGPRLSQFTHFIDSVQRSDWAQAAADMMHSRWALQVGARASRLHDMMLSGNA